MQNKVRETREGKGMTQLDLMRATGIAPSTISNIEKGRIHPWPGWRKKLSEALKVAEAELFPEVSEECTTPIE